MTKKNKSKILAVLGVAAAALLVASWAGPSIAWISGMAPSPGSPNDEGSSSHDLEADFALFTTEDVDGNGVSEDDKVVCTAEPEADEPNEPPVFFIHISVVNFDPDQNQLIIRFADGDLVTYSVPTGTSFSIVQVAGTTIGVDDTIEVDPVDADGDGLGMAGWVSVLEEEAESVSCTTVSF